MKRIGLAAALVSVLSVTVCHATVIFQTGFEQPDYAPGALAGQNGWISSSVPYVESGIAFSGSQAVAVDATGTSGQNIDDLGLNYTALGNPENVVTYDVEFMQSTLGTSSLWDVLAAFGSPGFISQVLVDGYGNVYIDSVGGTVNVSRGVWNDFQLSLDFSTQTASAYANGQFVGSETFESPATGLNPYQGVAFGINSSPGTDSGYFDNLTITSAAAAVPEPSTAWLIALGLAGAAVPMRRVKRSETNRRA